jgi:Domain of unknown function (DUF4062)
MDKKYQVFVSSTSKDLQEERTLVFDTILRLGSFPVGMERFPAMDEEQLKVIDRLIEECDYYVLIVAGCLGTQRADGRSFTEAEYEIALSKGVPVFVFLHEKPASLPINDSSDVAKWSKLMGFRDKVMGRGKLNAIYKDKSDLGIKVMHSLTDAIKAGSRIGWVRGDKLVSDSAARDILELQKQVEFWKGQAGGNENALKIASGEDETEIEFDYLEVSKAQPLKHVKAKVTWDSLFEVTGEAFFRGATESNILTAIGMHATYLSKPSEPPPSNAVQINQKVPLRVLIQFNRLGLILRDNDRWILSPKGEEKFFGLRAEKKDGEVNSKPESTNVVLIGTTISNRQKTGGTPDRNFETDFKLRLK